MSRSLIVLWTIWLTAVLSNPAALHTCPTHGSPGSQLASASRNPVSHGEEVALASTHGGHAHGGEGRGGQENGSSHDCTCLGLCCCAASVAAIVRAPELPDVPLLTVGHASFFVATHAEVERRHVQPFANGPPSEGALL